MTRVQLFGAVLASEILFTSVKAADVDSAYKGQIDAFHKQREASLKADGGWLTVTGLFWLKDGKNSLGSGPENDIVLPESAPAHLGNIDVTDINSAKFEAVVGGTTLGGKPVSSPVSIRVGQDVLAAGPLDLLVIKRNNRLAVRLKDKNSSLRKNFTRLDWYPTDESWRITGKFVKSAEPTNILLDTIIGEQTPAKSSGYVEFERNGQKFRLLALDQGKNLFFVIRDRTSGRSTYAASRFLYAEPSADGTVVLDFNRAQNPPCAFTTYATCPLPPPQNRLAIAIEAGEKKYEGGAAH